MVAVRRTYFRLHNRGGQRVETGGRRGGPDVRVLWTRCGRSGDGGVCFGWGGKREMLMNCMRRVREEES